MPYTFGFATPSSLQRHYAAHGHEVGATSRQHYEALADVFLGRPIDPAKQPTMHDCWTKSGDYVRFDEATGEFGVLTSDKYIRTYFIPDPAQHGFKSNLDYFKDRCNK